MDKNDCYKCIHSLYDKDYFSNFSFIQLSNGNIAVAFSKSFNILDKINDYICSQTLLHDDYLTLLKNLSNGNLASISFEIIKILDKNNNYNSYFV